MMSRLTLHAGLVLCAGLSLVQPRALFAHHSPATKDAARDVRVPAPPTSDISGTVADSASGQPIGSAQVSVMREGRILVNVSTDDFGRFTAHNVQPGAYSVSAHFIGFAPQTRTITVGTTGADVRIAFKLIPVTTSLSAIEVKAEVPLTVDVRTATQSFKQEEFHAAPTITPSQIVQQSIAGAVRAPTGEVHIRGQHAEYTYYVDGVPVPAGISGSVNELFDPAVVNKMDFQTGGWDAEFGNKNAAIINVTTKIPAGALRVNAAGSAGSFGTATQALSMSGNAGDFGMFLSGGHQTTDMRREPVLFDTTTFRPVNFHNNGQDDYGFGKLQYNAGLADLVSLDLSWSRTRFQVPYDSTGGATAGDHQTDLNTFANLGWRHLFGDPKVSTEESPAELFSGFFYRTGSLKYVPGASDDPQFVIFPDTLHPYNLSEDRNFTTIGAKIDLTVRPAHELSFKSGVLVQRTTGHENFSTIDANGHFGPQSISGLTGGDAGGYAQMSYAPMEEFELRTGVRYDVHNAPFAPTQSQLSPRIRLNYFPDPSTTIYVYYGRQFIPTNVEDLRSITSAAQGEVDRPTLPERDNFYEAGLVHRFETAGLVTKLSTYYKESTPGIDDNTVPGSAIVTSVNLAHVWVTGIEGVVEVRPDGPFSGYLNAALNHGYGQGPITGGFFPEATPSGYFDLDHDQRLSLTGSVTYSLNRLFLSGTGIYGSGLTNGVDPSDCGCTYGTGLFNFNKGIKVDPSTIFNASAGYSIGWGDNVLRPQIYVENIFDKHYLLKGAFFSGASVGRPRSIQFRLSVGV